MDFVLMNPQHINVSHPVNEETIPFQQAIANMIILSTEKSCDPLLATMQIKENISSCNCLISLAQKSTENTVY
jgi:hypothetical protein